MQTPLTKEKIIGTLQHPQHLEKLKAYGVTQLGLYGSFARGEGREDSNINFLVDWRDDDAQVEGHFPLQHLLEELFHKQVILMSVESLDAPIPLFQSLKKKVHKELMNIPLSIAH